MAALFIYALAFIAPALGGEIQHSFLKDAPRVTETVLGIRGDPINVALIGTKEDLVTAMLAARWQPADPITFTSCVKIVTSVVLHRPYETAPVSHLYLWKRKQDLAFEQQVGKDASRRHHVRFWESPMRVYGRPLWLGAVTFDTDIGISRTTGMVTHHIAANIDADRDKLLDDLAMAGRLLSLKGFAGFQPKPDGRNGDGDPYHTDGRLLLGGLFSWIDRGRYHDPNVLGCRPP